MDIYVYEYCGKQYINLTNECNNNCDFCVRKNENGLDGYELWLNTEPTAKDVIDELKKRSAEKGEIVFCGFGEPTLRIEVLKEVARFMKENGGSTRLNTNGLANAYYGRNILPELKGLIDVISISLNESDAEKYEAICHSVYGKEAYGYMIDFAKKSVQEGIKTVLSVVDVISPEGIERCRQIAEEVGAEFRVRTYIK